MSLINQPPNVPVDTNGKQIAQGWATFFSTIFNIVNALVMSGTTTNRPVKFLWVGRPYFDTTIGRPIWYNGTIWIFSDGTPA